MTTTIANAGDLRTAYLQTYESFAIVPGDIVDSSEGRVNNRYARELLGTLVSAGLVTESENGEGETVWQTFPDTYDTMSLEEAEAKVDQWLATTNTIEGNQPANTNTQKDKTMTVAAPAEVHNCYCGCNEQVPAKSYYRPGHDARHAGALGRELAAQYPNYTDEQANEVLGDLPSERLVAKAKGIADKAIEKANAKRAREDAKEAAKIAKDEAKATEAEPEFEEGSITVGKNEFVARRNTKTGDVTYFKGEEEKVASKNASKTFTA